MATPQKTDLTCSELVDLVTDYLEGALPPRDRLDFERHREAALGDPLDEHLARRPSADHDDIEGLAHAFESSQRC